MIIPHSTPILSRKQETHDTFSIEIEVPATPNLGQFNMLSAFGIGESAISLSKIKDRIVTHTIRVVGDVTQRLSNYQIGESIAIRGPFGTSWPVSTLKNSPLLIIAGGIGLAPLRPVIEWCLANKQEVHLIYGSRRPEDQLYQAEVSDWLSSFPCYLTVDQCLDKLTWKHHIGVVTPLIPKALSTLFSKPIVFMCGPEAMMHFCLNSLQDCQIPDENIYLSMERNMTCGTGHCGHCQWGPFFICKDGPVMHYPNIRPFLYKKEL